jgi:hypothetical protein
MFLKSTHEFENFCYFIFSLEKGKLTGFIVYIIWNSYCYNRYNFLSCLEEVD